MNWIDSDVFGPGGLQLGQELRCEDTGYHRGPRRVQHLVIGLRDKIEQTIREESEKVQRLFQEVILRTCGTVLSRASEIWVIGYRFPDADLPFRELL